ncbi:MAG: sodium:calcium antiporter [Gammaproteobacteria bacterium]
MHAMPVGAEIALSLLIILVAAEVFTNAVEHLGEGLGISEGVTGSLFAAVATAMPETMVPILAFFTASNDSTVSDDIGVGAILGAPLMLSTLSLALMAFSVLRRRGAGGEMRPEPTGMRRDLNFFLLAFGIAGAALFVPPAHAELRASLAILLVMIYFFYVMMTVRASSQLVADGHGTEAHTNLFLCRLGVPDGWPAILVQLVIGFGLLIFGAHSFIDGVERLSTQTAMSALVLSLLIIPVATELPEKVNSILWARRGKDTLAFGNITGAMVFQGSILPAIGMAMTPWSPDPAVVAGFVVTLAAAIWLHVALARGRLRVWHLAVNGGLYLAYLGYVVG